MTLPIHAVGLQSLVKDMLLATDTVQVSHTHAAFDFAYSARNYTHEAPIAKSMIMPILFLD